MEVLPELRKTYVGPETGLLESEIKKYQKENNLGRMAAAHARLGETHAFDPRSPYMQWFLNKYNIRLNYNKDGCALPEDNKDIKKRQLQAVNEIISRVKGGKNVWIVDHGMQWLLEELISGDLPKIPTTTPYILHFDPHGYTGYEIIDTKDREIKERVLTPGLREAMSILQTDGHNVAVEHLENGLSDCSAKWIKMCSQMNYVNER